MRKLIFFAMYYLYSEQRKASKEVVISHLDKLVQPSYMPPTQIIPLALPLPTSRLVNIAI